jgi:transketolase
VRFGWDRYIGDAGGVVGISGLVLRVPPGELFNLFGITPEAIVTETVCRARPLQ